MRSDPEFRAAVHLFLREFDKVLSAFEPSADEMRRSFAAVHDTNARARFLCFWAEVKRRVRTRELEFAPHAAA